VNSGGKPGSGGAAAGGSTTSAGGSTTLASGGQTSGSGGGTAGQGGNQGGGGGVGSGGTSNAGGSTTSSSGGTSLSGGTTSGSGGGTQARGGSQGGGGSVTTGGISGSGGRSATGGTAGGGTSGSAATGGAGGSTGTQKGTGGTIAGTDIWNLPKFPVAQGPFTADWKALGLAYSTPQWWRDAKFGAWAHWDPQSMPERGDWYALRMYQVGSAQYNYHIATFGDPSVYGYKDICKNWVVDKWDPNALMDLYVQMGAKFFMSMGSHHDNFDNFDSAYQPWNSVKVGVKKDMVGTWEPIARQKGLRFGIGFHNTPARTYGQWMPVRYTSGAKGPFDALLTKADGKGQWWDGMDPVDLYGPKHSGDCSNNSCNNSAYGTQFMYRVDDAISKYHPDVVYFDDHAGDSQVDLGIHMGFGSIATTIVANYYNKSLTWKQGPVDVVMNMKGVGGQYNSFQNSASTLPFAERALVRSTEASTESAISAYPFQTEVTIQDWHYNTGQGYIGAASLVTTLMQNVSRNGSLMLNLTQHGRGDLDPQCTQIAKDIGAWLKVNGEAVYASRPFEVWGDNSVLYTRAQGNVYATLLNWNGGAVTLSALKSGGATLGTVSKVEVLGSTTAITFSQSATGLTVTPSGSVPALTGISDSQVAKSRVLRITHSKGWINDDDSGVSSPGWQRKVALGTGDYNNDLTTSTTVGDTWTATFTGTDVAVYAPKESGDGKIEIQIDGQTKDTVDLSASGARQAQQLVSEATGLTAGQHTISIVNRGPGTVAVDAIVVK
jgi:alpha-L-fucosidase